MNLHYGLPLPLETRSLYVINHSGGKDSQAMMIELLKLLPPSNLLVVHASLGETEWYGALEKAKEQAEAAGVQFLVARAEKSLLEKVEARFATRPDAPSWPSSSARWCTSDLKRDPIQREIRRYATAKGFRTIVNCMGLRAQESASRAKKEVFRSHAGQTNGKREWFEWLPIHDWSTEQVFASIRKAGQIPHWAYQVGNERLSCVFCIFGSKNDLKNGAKERPDLFAKYVEMEKRTGYTMHMSRIPLQELVARSAESKLY